MTSLALNNVTGVRDVPLGGAWEEIAAGQHFCGSLHASEQKNIHRSFLVSPARVPFCPKCLQEFDQADSCWGFTTTTHCTKHGTQLIDTCEVTGDSITLAGLAGGISESGKMLATQSVGEFSSPGRSMSRLGNDLLNGTKNSSTFWEYLYENSGSFLDFIAIIVLVLGLRAKGRFDVARLSNAQPLHERSNAILEAAPYILDEKFPARLFELLDQYKAGYGETDARSFAAAFPRVYGFSARKRRSRIPRAIINMLLADYVDERFSECVPQFTRASEIYHLLNRRYKFIASSSVCDTTGANPGIVHRSAEKLGIKTWKSTVCHQATALYSSHDLDELKQAINDDREYKEFIRSAPVADTASALGTSGKLVRALITENVLDGITLGTGRNYPTRVTTESISRFEARLKANATPLLKLEDTVNLRKLLSTRSQRLGLNLTTALTMAFENKLKFSLSGRASLPILHRLVVSRAEISKVIESIDSGNQQDMSLPKSRVSRVLGCSEAVVDQLIDQGWIQAQKNTELGIGTHICTESVETFEQNYASPKRIVRCFGGAASFAREIARRHGIEPAINIAVGGHVTSFFPADAIPI